MLRARLLARAITAALLISAACGPDNVATPPAPQAPGSPTGDPTRGSVGAVGGSVTARGGGLVVAVPAGATPSPVELSVTEITNTAPHGVGSAYRLGPEGTRFSAPVALIFRVDPEVSVSDLTVATQDPTGFWVRVSSVRRDPIAHTVVATTTHFSDWALVVAPSDRDLSGIFRIASTRDGVVANGQSRFFYEDGDESSNYYLQYGRISVETPIARPGATCEPTVATKDVGPNIGEIHSDPSRFIWGATGIWDVACTPTAGGSPTQDFASVVFENLGINYPRCTRSYLAPPLVQTDEVQGSYQINCGAEGTINADWHFQRCVPGEPCQTANLCKTAAINCDSGLPLCVENGNVTNGTICDVDPTAPYEVCGDGVCNVCRLDAECTPTNNCHAGTITCDTGFEVCTDTGASLANGTVCGTNQVCFTGTCVACTAGTACSTNPNPCVAGQTDCSTGQEVCVDTATPIANGTTCGVDQVCNGGTCVACVAGAVCDTNPTFCLGGLTSCATGSSVCLDNAASLDPNGTTCGTNQVCNDGVCNACTAGNGCSANPNPCVAGTTSCATGVETCVDTTTNIDNGTSCGTNQVCNGGVCTACTADLTCATNPNPCVAGTTSCATGTSTCVNTATQIPNGTTCGTDQVCNGGTCVTCTAGVACTTNPNSCVDGTTSCATGTSQCVDTGTAKANGTSCGTNQVCLGGVCNACTGGLPCAYNSNPCVDGVTSCATGSETCENTATPKAGGTVCGTNQVCNGAGACNACTAGVGCTTNPTFCLTGLTSCSTGAETCIDNALVPEPNGLSCGTNQVCNGGACATCAAGGACSTNPNPCVDGVFSCATGTQECVDTATPKTNGTSCGTDQVCNGGICSACTANAACTTNPDQACNDGITSCATGTQACIDGAAKPNGTSCGTNQVCNGGTCSPCTANAACATNPNAACLEGITSCATGTQECLDSGPKPNGTACDIDPGVPEVCNGGVCTSCTAGLTCNTNPTPCFLGTTSCETGVQTCVDTATPAPNGTTCDVNVSVPEVCFNGTCNGCVAGAACSTNANPCVTGLTSCATGQQTCENTATTIANGTTCDVNPSEPEVCLDGTCNACTAGVSCTTNPNAACMNGVTSCSTGSSVCLDWTPKQDGTACGTDMVCLAGVCGVCSAGDLCSTNPDPCLTGITSCSTGTQACLDNTLVPEGDGTICGTNQVCNGGVCTGCTAGISCDTNPGACVAGTTSCSTGTQTCVDTAAALPDGTGCGTNQVCNGGACVSCTAGQACATNPDPCLTGTTSCSSGTPICVDNAAAPEPSGTICGSNQVCNGGVCTGCVGDVACTTNPDPCRTGITSCSTGTQTCVDTATPEPNGTSCGTNQVCNGGTCVGCTAGGACATNPNPCVDGVSSCNTGSQTCEDTAAPKAAGTICGTNLVCNGSGACVGCTAGVDCTPANSCTVHETSCASGSQTCVDTFAQVANGTVCGTDQVCNGGVCSACTAGQTCTDNANLCLVGTTSCATGARQCIDTAAELPNGTGCGTNQVCNAGACVTCAGGAACTTNPNPCVDGVESCDTGALTCANTATAKANGTSCGTDQVCNGGTCVGCVAAAPCVSNPNICVAGVTSCATGTQVCEDGATPANDGAECGPDLVCNAGACIRVITGTRLVTRWTTGAGCSAAAPCTTTTVAPDVLTAFVEAIGPDGTRYPGTFSGTGSFSIPNVPPGPYTLAFTDGSGVTYFIETSSTTVDLGYDVLGREATAATVPTPVTISVSELSAWIPSDEVQITAPEVDLWDVPISGAEIQPNQVAGSVVEDWSASSIGRPLNLLAATDAVWVHQLATSTVTGPDLTAYAYQAATRSAGTAVVPDMTNGGAASISATVAPITQTGTLVIDWRTTQFEALLGSMGPSAQPAASPHALAVRTLPYALSSPAPAGTSAPELFRLLVPAAAADANLSGLAPPIVYGRFLDQALWSEWRDARFTARVSYTAPGAATPLDALATVSRREPMLPTPSSPIVPEVGTVQGPLVNGANALGTLGSVGLTPTISWSAPTIGAPSSYRVTLRELFVGAGSTSASRVVATFTTTGGSLTVPAGVLVAGRTYFAEITARVRAPEQFTTAPNRANAAGSDASTLTSTFTP